MTDERYHRILGDVQWAVRNLFDCYMNMVTYFPSPRDDFQGLCIRLQLPRSRQNADSRCKVKDAIDRWNDDKTFMPFILDLLRAPERPVDMIIRISELPGDHRQKGGL